jgi:hypothetical protein
LVINMSKMTISPNIHHQLRIHITHKV